MKKKVLALAALFCALGMGGCENSTDITAAYITESTSAGSENYGVRITYAEDSRLEGKYTDVQVRFSQKGEIVLWKEGQNKITYNIPDYDEWYSLTSIFAQGQGKSGSEQFELYDAVKSKSYLFNSDINQEITFRVVVGKVESNFQGDGQILVGSEPISGHFKLKIHKK